MGTSFESIYARYRSRIRDYDFVNYDAAVQEAVQRSLLDNAIDDFAEFCKNDLTSFNEKETGFVAELTRREQEILALSMICHWVEPFVFNTDALQNALNTKDFSLYSPANLLEKMTALLKKTEAKLRAQVNLYTFKNGDISDLAKEV